MDVHFRCDVCGVDVCGELNWKAHQEGQKHKKKINRIGDQFSCQICQTTVSGSAAWDQHLAGRKHLAAARRQAALPQNSELCMVSPLSNSVYCEVCNVECTCIESYNMHIKGTAHTKCVAVKARHDAGQDSHIPYCSICNIECSSMDGLDTHKQGQTHIRRSEVANRNRGSRQPAGSQQTGSESRIEMDALSAVVAEIAQRKVSATKTQDQPSSSRAIQDPAKLPSTLQNSSAQSEDPFGEFYE